MIGDGTRLIITKKKSGGGTRLHFSGDITIYTARKLRDLLAGFIGRGGPIELDLSDVERIDTAGLQLLVSAKRECARKGLACAVTGRSREVTGILDLLGSAL